MPNNSHAISWTTAEFEKLVELVKPRQFLHHVQDPSRKNILAREAAWEQISRELGKPVEDCKKRWRALRDGYMKTLRVGNKGNMNVALFTKLDFLNEPEDMGTIDTVEDDPKTEPDPEPEVLETIETMTQETVEEMGEKVIMDNQEYYEITLVDNPQELLKTAVMPKLLLPPLDTEEPPKKIGRKNCGRKKYQPPPPHGLHPIKILPKPICLNTMNGANIMYVEEKPKVTPPPPPPPQPQKSEVLDSLIEKVLKEHTNEIDVFFRSMAASVKKLQPNLIPKVKMEVCNVIAKYEMQSFEKNTNYLSNS